MFFYNLSLPSPMLGRYNIWHMLLKYSLFFRYIFVYICIPLMHVFYSSKVECCRSFALLLPVLLWWNKFFLKVPLPIFTDTSTKKYIISYIIKYWDVTCLLRPLGVHISTGISKMYPTKINQLFQNLQCSINVLA